MNFKVCQIGLAPIQNLMSWLFGDCALDAERRELKRRAEPAAIGPQVFDLLLFLIENRARVVSKDDLIEAIWHGRIVSESSITTHINAARSAIGDNGQEQRFIRTLPRKGFRFVGEVSEAPAARKESGAAPPTYALSLSDRPSIAVLPFDNLSGDPAQDYFADGVVEDVIAALSRNRCLFVIARNSSFAFKGRTIDVMQIGRELGVRYVIEGSLRKAANRVRIAVELADATSGGHLWADRYEGELGDIFDLQDRLTEGITGAVAPQVERAEIDRAIHKPTDSLGAYDYFLRGMAGFHTGGRAGNDHAASCFGTATALDPEYSSAYAMAGWCIYTQILNGWRHDGAEDRAEGERLARRAIDLGQNDAVALARGGHALALFTGDVDTGSDLLERALALNPNLAAAWHLSAFLRLFKGEPDEAIERFEHAMRLSPLDPEMFRLRTGIALAHLTARRFDVASTWATKSFRDAPNLVLPGFVLAASHAVNGRDDEASRVMSSVCALHPELTFERLRRWLPFQKSAHVELLADSWKKAGLRA